MSKVWSAKVHVSGDRIQLLKNGSVTKVIRAASDTFEPKVAKEFAQGLVDKLNKSAKQMTDTEATPSVDTKGEEQAKALKSVNTDAKGISVKEASAIKEENTNLKKRIAHMEKDAAIERKARRGLAIVKTLVDQNKIANDESAIKSEVMKITAMSNEEIGLLEKKVAGIKLYASAEEALTASRRHARMARLHRQAAEDAQLAGNVKLADEEDERAEHCEALAKEATNVAGEYAQYKAEPEAGTAQDISKQIEKNPPKGVGVNGKKASEDNPDADEESDELIEDVDDDEGLDEDEDLDEDMEVEATCAIYKKIAADHKKKAEEFKAAGKEKEAATEEEIASEAEEMADSMEDDDDDDMEIEAAAAIYKKIASDHKKKAEEYEAEGKKDQAKEECEIADEAEQLANSILTTKTAEDDDDDDDDDDNKRCSEAASIYKRIAAEHRKKADEYEAEGQSDEADEEDEIADEAEQLAATVESSMKKTSEEEADDDDNTPIESMEAKPVAAEPAVASVEGKKAEEAADAGKVEDEPPMKAEIRAADVEAADEGAKKTDEVADAKEEDDPLAALMGDEEKAASDEAEAEDDGKMPTDDEINAAVGGDDMEDEDEKVDGAVKPDEGAKEAAATATKKVANEGHKNASYDRIEQNPMAFDAQAQELESLWRKDAE